MVEVSAQVSRDEDLPIRKYDKILFHPKNAIPVDLEPDNLLFVVPIEDVVAVFRPARAKGVARESEDDSLGDDEIREMLLAKKPGSEIRKKAKEKGMAFLRDSALERVRDGITTLREINKVTFIEAGR